MTASSGSVHSRRRAVRLWLLIVAAMMVLTLVVGGATRLTESGLSITEWKPVLGVVPPLSDADWQTEFQKYQSIPQYREVNRGMSLDAFKTIYWWEWSHRLLARTIGAVFFFPFVFFLWRGWIEPHLRKRLWLIFGGGAALGAVGWWMVSSGLTERTSVSQYRLAFHLTLACAIYAAIVWTAQQVMPRPPVVAPARTRNLALLIAFLVLGQIYLGALVAGLDAGLVYNTWPLIDGHLIPDSARLWFDTPWWRNLFENHLTVQFQHRMLAYLIWILAMLHAADALRLPRGDRGRTLALIVAALVTVQAGIGIATLLLVVPLDLAITHQAMAVVVLTVAVIHAERLRHRVERRPLDAPAGAVEQPT
jgi:cytochrome c oxidase assembly protein subunit 15